MQQSSLFLFLHNLTGHSLLFDALTIVFARYFQYIVIAYAVILAHRTFSNREKGINKTLYIKKVLNEVFWVLSSVTLAYVVSVIMKNAFALPRPFLSGTLPLFEYGGFNSFPSGHATLFAALTISMFFFHKVRGFWFLASAIVIGFARVIAGVHYPIDIFAGYCIGGLSAYFVCVHLRPKLQNKINLFKI